MSIVIPFVVFIFIFGVLFGYVLGHNDQYEVRARVRSDADRIIDAMYKQRAADYFNNPVVRELQKSKIGIDFPHDKL